MSAESRLLARNTEVEEVKIALLNGLKLARNLIAVEAKYSRDESARAGRESDYARILEGHVAAFDKIIDRAENRHPGRMNANGCAIHVPPDFPSGCPYETEHQFGCKEVK